MKNVFFKTMMIAGMASVSMSSCVNEIEDLYDPSYAAKTIKQYETQWKIQFGSVDPEHNWGFTNNSSDAKALTRNVIKEKHDWESQGVQIPADVTSEEIDKVNAYLLDKENIQRVSQLNFSDYWIQQVSSTADGQSYLNGMHVVKSNGTEEHVLDFNHATGKTVLMQNSGTADFFCSSSYNNKKIADYVIVEIDGAYYLGFELYDEKEDNGIKNIGGDGIYNDWVLKLTPAEYKNAQRIICEDLGNIGDFDFNDIVFDAYITWVWNGTEMVPEAVISVKAAGGTLPIYIGDVEVHEALGVPTNVMVNTGAPNGVNAPVAIFRIPVSNDNVADIEVKVNDAIVLQAPQGNAPQKICVPTTFKWCTERTNIKDAYPGFIDWSQNQNNNNNWYENPIDDSVM